MITPDFMRRVIESVFLFSNYYIKRVRIFMLTYARTGVMRWCDVVMV